MRGQVSYTSLFYIFLFSIIFAYLGYLYDIPQSYILSTILFALGVKKIYELKKKITLW